MRKRSKLVKNSWQKMLSALESKKRNKSKKVKANSRKMIKMS